MAHTFDNIDFQFGDGTPATIRGRAEPFSIPAGPLDFVVFVNGVEKTTSVLSTATVATDIAAQFLSDLGLVLTAPSGVLTAVTENSSVNATIVVDETSPAAAHLGFRGEATGVTHPDDPEAWTFDGFSASAGQFEPMVFDDDSSPHAENWGQSDFQQQFPELLLFKSGSVAFENFGGWAPGDTEFPESGVFVTLLFLDPPSAGALPLIPDAAAEVQVSVTALSFEGWAVQPIPLAIIGEGAPFEDPFLFNEGLSSEEVWGGIKEHIGHPSPYPGTLPFEFNDQHGGPVGAGYPETAEKFERTLLGDMYLVFDGGAPGDAKNLVLTAINVGSGAEDDTLDAQLIFDFPAGILPADGVGQALAFYNQMKLSAAIDVELTSEANLGVLGLDTDLTVIVVYSRTPALFRIDLDTGGEVDDVNELEVALDYSQTLEPTPAAPAEFQSARPETHWHRRLS
jgi:hypothetical protein